MIPLLAEFNPGEIFPFMLGVIMLITPIVAILTSHQRKMAEIIHGRNRVDAMPSATEVQLAGEVARLRDIVAQQAIAIDNMSKSHAALEQTLKSQDSQLEARLSS